MRFRSQADPMADVMGSTYDSNPEELKQIKDQLDEWGVEINENEDSENIGYGCTRHGMPGVLSINRSASYSAWLHEFQHVKDDKEGGWNGVDILFDKEKHIAWEKRAYQIEIDLAKSLNREDIVKKLEENLENEIQRIKRLF